MATQRTDGTWTPIEPIEPALQTFLTELNLGTAKALHVGAPAEILDEMRKAGLQEQIDEIRQEMADNLDREILSDVLEIPTREDVAEILKGGPDGDSEG